MPNAVPTAPPFGGEFRKALPTFVLAIAFSFGASYLTDLVTKTETRMRLESLEKTASVNAKHIEENASMFNAMTNENAKTAEVQHSIMTQMQDIKDRQASIEQRLLRIGR